MARWVEIVDLQCHVVLKLELYLVYDNETLTIMDGKWQQKTIYKQGLMLKGEFQCTDCNIYSSTK